MKIDAVQCAKLLLENDDIRIICHRDPDGDTLGSSMALFDTLTNMGKRVFIECASPFPANLQFLCQPLRDMKRFEPKFTVAVDVATPSMICDPPESRPHIDLCIDHHPTNPDYADNTYLVNYGAAAEAVFEVIKEMGAEPGEFAATALLTAISSDTGGMRYSSTRAQTLRTAAYLIERGADFNLIRVALFESKSRGQVTVESQALSAARYYENGRIAVISITRKMLAEAKVDESELEGLAAKPIEIMGVDIGITLKERDDGSIRVSVRTTAAADASKICAQFEGGGHVRASGCRLWCDLEKAENDLVAASVKELL